MKNIFFFLSFSFCLLSLTQAQNPYVEQSFPWLNLKQVKESKIKTIMLATTGDDGTVKHQTVLSFNSLGLLVKEDHQTGYRYTNVFVYQSNNNLNYCISTDNSSSDTMWFEYLPAEKLIISRVYKVNSSGGYNLSLNKYEYDANQKLAAFERLSGSVPDRNNMGKNGLSESDRTTYSWIGENMLSMNSDYLETRTYSDDGKLLTMKTENILYEIAEDYEYSYDQSGQLVMITKSDGETITKTFVTYEFYQ